LLYDKQHLQLIANPRHFKHQSSCCVCAGRCS
jgi:hypothetical protein